MKKNKKKKITKKDKRKYHKYLLSKKWKDFRESAFEFFGRQCGLCGNKHKLQLHHKSYRNIFKETFADVIILCSHCHGIEHKGRFRQKRRTDTETVTYYPNRKKIQ